MKRSAALLGLCALACGGGATLPELEPGAAPTTASASGQTADQILGLNEAITVPPALAARNRMNAAQLEAHMRDNAALAQGLGARWVRGHNAGSPWLHYQDFPGFDQADMVVRAAQDHDLQLVLVLGPWQGNKTGAFTSSYEVDDPQGYTAWVSSVVERYDGDGVDDMPGLEQPVKYWEIDNEPDLKNSILARGAAKKYDPTTFCTSRQYTQVFELSAAAVRTADAQATVLNGGFYRPHAPQGDDYMRAVMGQDPSNDVLSVHAYYDGPGTEVLERALKNASSVAGDRPIWLTETSVASQGERWQTQAWQADMVVRTVALALSYGVERVFWHSLTEPPTPPKGVGMGYHSLITVSGKAPPQEKLAAAAYRRLASLLSQVPRDQVRVNDGRLLLGEHELVLEGRVDSGTVVATGQPAKKGHDASQAAVWRPLAQR